MFAVSNCFKFRCQSTEIVAISLQNLSFFICFHFPPKQRNDVAEKWIINALSDSKEGSCLLDW